MIGRRSPGRSPGRRGGRLLLGALVAVPVLSLLFSTPVRAEFATVAPNWVAWQWTTDPGADSHNPKSTQQVRAVAVRSDGWLIVAAEDALHVIPPWGADISQSNQFGPQGLYPYDMVMRDGALYATVETDVPQEPCHLFKIDPHSGRVLGTFSFSWMQCYIPHITIDPLTDDLVMQASEPPPCPPTPSSSGTVPFVPGTAQPSCPQEPAQHPIVEWNPDSGAMTTLVANPKTPYSDLGFTADSSAVYVGEMVQVPQSAPLYIDAYARHHGILSDQPIYRVPLHGDSGVDGMTVGDGSRCFGNSLIYTDSWSDVYWVPHPGPASTASIGLATTPYTPGPVRYADAAGNVTRDTSGNAVIGEYNSVMILSCPGFRPPAPPRLPVPGLARLVTHIAAPGRPAAPSAAAPSQGPPPPAAPAGPAPAPGLGASSQASTQAVAAPNAAGVGDVVEDQPALHLTATARVPGPLPGIDLAVGALVVTGLAGCAWAALETTESPKIAPRRRKTFQTGDPR